MLEVPSTEDGGDCRQMRFEGEDDEFSFGCVKFEVSEILVEVLN